MQRAAVFLDLFRANRKVTSLACHGCPLWNNIERPCISRTEAARIDSRHARGFLVRVTRNDIAGLSSVACRRQAEV